MGVEKPAKIEHPPDGSHCQAAGAAQAHPGALPGAAHSERRRRLQEWAALVPWKCPAKAAAVTAAAAGALPLRRAVQTIWEQQNRQEDTTLFWCRVEQTIWKQRKSAAVSAGAGRCPWPLGGHFG
jgi:hypothetical protein